MMRFRWIPFVFLLAACSTPDAADLQEAARLEETASQQNMEYQKGLELFQKQEYAETIEHFQAFQQKFSTSKLIPAAIYYKGLAQEKLSQWLAARDTFKSVQDLWGPKNYVDRTNTLYHLANTYQQLYEDDRALATLLSIQNSRFLAKEIHDIDIPARLALLYARNGNRDTALIYYNTATKNLSHYLKLPPAKISKAWMSEALYQIALIPQDELNEETFDKNVEMLKLSQAYLFRIMEMNQAQWPQKAKEQILTSYKQLYEKNLEMHDTKSTGDIVSKRLNQESLKQNAEKILLALELLKLEALPTVEYGSTVKSLFSDLQEYQKKLEKIVNERPEGEGLTPDADRREGIRREGTIRSSPSHHSRKKTLRPQKNTLPLKSSTPTQDPNL